MFDSVVKFMFPMLKCDVYSYVKSTEYIMYHTEISHRSERERDFDTYKHRLCAALKNWRLQSFEIKNDEKGEIFHS